MHPETIHCELCDAPFAPAPPGQHAASDDHAQRTCPACLHVLNPGHRAGQHPGPCGPVVRLLARIDAARTSR